MAKTFQTQLPQEFEAIVDEIREVRARNLDSTSNTEIVKDAIKLLHKKVCKR